MTDSDALDAADSTRDSLGSAASSASSPAGGNPRSYPGREGALISQADRQAAQLVTEFGVPQDYDQAVNLLAYAYAKGNRAGYDEAAQDALESYGRLQRLFEEAAQ